MSKIWYNKDMQKSILLEALKQGANLGGLKGLVDQKSLAKQASTTLKLTTAEKQAMLPVLGRGVVSGLKHFLKPSFPTLKKLTPKTWKGWGGLGGLVGVPTVSAALADQRYNPFAISARRDARKIDTKIDTYNEGQRAKTTDDRPNHDANGNPIVINRGSTFSRDGRKLYIKDNVPADQRRAIIDTFDAVNRLERQRQQKPYGYATTGTGQSGSDEYHPAEAVLTLVPNYTGIRLGQPLDYESSDETNWSAMHEGSHMHNWRNKSIRDWWRDCFTIGLWDKPLFGGNSLSERIYGRPSSVYIKGEQKAQETGKRLNKFVHPDTKVPDHFWDRDTTRPR